MTKIIDNINELMQKDNEKVPKFESVLDIHGDWNKYGTSTERFKYLTSYAQNNDSDIWIGIKEDGELWVFSTKKLYDAGD